MNTDLAKLSAAAAQELLPCPFCGASVATIWESPTIDGDGTHGAEYLVDCRDADGGCCASVVGDTEPEAITAWNTRNQLAERGAGVGELEWMEELEDEIENAIADSFDVDWVPRDGARHVVGLLKHMGITTALAALGGDHGRD